MRKYANVVSTIALILTMIICFSGCGIVDFARSAIKKNNTEVSGVETPQDSSIIVPGNQSVTNSAVISPSASGNNSNKNTNTNSNKPDTTQGTTPTTQVGNNDVTSQSSKPSANNKPQKDPQENETQPNKKPPVTDENITEEDLKEMPIKDVQDLLFATEDPNTAGKILELAGFEYDEKQGIYYSQMNPLQRKFGFNLVYDMAAPMTGMIYDTKRIEFNYDNREWMIQIWKGQYGMTAGAEIGLYNRDPSRNFQYDCADDEDLIEMQFDFYNQNEFVFSRGPEKHWWLTGFKILHIGMPILIDLDMKLKFTDKLMAQAFVKSLRDVAGTSLLDPIKYQINGSTVTIQW